MMFDDMRVMLKNSFHKGRHRLIVTFLLSYIVILLIPLLISSLVYSKAVSMITENTFEANLSLLEQSRDITDRRLNEIENIAHQLALDPRTAVFLEWNDPLDSEAYYEITKYIYHLKNYWLINNEFILEFLVYFRKIDSLVTSKTVYSLSGYYGSYLQYHNWDETLFKNEILDSSQSSAYLPAVSISFGEFSETRQEYSAITYLQSIPIGRFGTSKGMIVVFIDNSMISSLLERIEVGNTGFVYITDRNGVVISQTNDDILELIPQEEVDMTSGGYIEVDTPKGRMMITQTISARNGWRYVSVIPTSVVMAKAEYIKKLILAIVIAALIFGLIAAFYLASVNIRPVKGLINTLKDALGSEVNDETNEYMFLQSGIGNIIKKNNRLLETVIAHMPLLKVAFFNRLFRGGFNNMQELMAAAQNVGITISGNLFIAIMIRINGYAEYSSQDILNELNLKKLLIRDVMVNRLGMDDYFNDVSENKIAWLKRTEHSEIEAIKTAVTSELISVYENLRSEYNMKLSFAAGAVCGSLTDIWHSFNEANRAMDDFLFGSNTEIIAWADQVQTDAEKYYFNNDAKQKLINLVISGDASNTTMMLDTIFNENFIKRKLNWRMTRRLFYELEATLINLMDKLSLKDEVDDILSTVDKNTIIEEIFSNLKKELLRLCDIVNNQKRSHNIRLKDKILEHINTCYTNPEMCLCSVADHVGLSETYLSQFFKEQTGENFAAYLENLRISHARKLLCVNDMPVGDITSATGYNSDHAFRRAFKRVTGISPTEYRNINCSKR